MTRSTASKALMASAMLLLGCGGAAVAEPDQYGAVEPLIQIPIAEAPHGISAGQAAERRRHADQMAMLQQSARAALDALPLSDREIVADAIRAGLDAKPGSGFHARKDWAALRAFYEERTHAPAWTSGGTLTPQAVAVVKHLQQAHRDGLDPSDYAISGYAPGLTSLDSLEAKRDFELGLSLAVIRYTRHAQAGRLNPRTVSKTITMSPEIPDGAEALRRIHQSTDPVALIDGYNPPHPAFQALREALHAALDGTETQKGDTSIKIPEGPLLRPGSNDKRVPLIRARLGLPANETDLTAYDGDIVAAIVALQESSGLPSQGIFGNLTRAVLNGEGTGSTAKILVNMERWRWMPRELGRHHVYVNIPEFLVRIVDQGAVTHTTRVVVGKRKHKTPVFSDAMDHIVVNPSWNVPSSIARNYWPQVRRDPRFLARNNMQVLYRGQVVNPRRIRWRQYRDRPLPFRLRQKPGTGNALGNIKFMFPNEHAVYLHDTPSRSLFSRQVRAYSHGCVRVHKPFEFADALLANEARWNGAKLKSMIGRGGERTVRLDVHIPVHLAYFTAVATDAGGLRFHGDIYGHDKRMAELLGL